ncbi:SRPBCC domain-containing protein [Streptomyces fradiae]|uniref:SRPBCC domain-containing protein n=1 Tax=Streptomyces fradiae TaxID=1906 RepID=UPI0038082CD7
MEHEVFVPVPVPSLRAVFADPARVARCVPGLQQDADASADPLSGRLKVRAGGHTVTYRGALRLAARDDGGYDLSGEGAEARGGGGVRVALTARLTPADGGTDLAFTGTAGAEGRLAEIPADTLTTTARRLLDRFGEALAEEAGDARRPEQAGGAGGAAKAGQAGQAGQAARADGPGATHPDTDATAGAATADATGTTDATDAAGDGGGDGVPDDDHTAVKDGATASEAVRADADADVADLDNVDLDVDDDGVDDGAVGAAGPEGAAPGGGVFGTPVPPSSLDPDAADDYGDDLPGDDLRADGFPEEGPSSAGAEPPAEAAHARRTMIGRSAEEVDHAPPRGRYAPVPGPDAHGRAHALRLLVPAAALVLASAVVLVRLLRHRTRRPRA